VTFDWQKLSGVPDVKPEDQVNPKHYPAIDTKGVLAGCLFLHHAKKEPNKIDEAQWYAMLSIVGRLKDGPALCHEMSQGHKGYSREETEVKINQALDSSGPRTCKNIGRLFPGCKDCAYYEKISSPITIKGKDFIETESTGFHKVYVNAKGNLTVGKPQFDDLRKHFERSHPYRTMGESGICYMWNGTHYEIMGDLHLEEYAQARFEPKALTHMTKEFKSLVCRTNLTPPDWFTRSTEKKINFKNGVLDLRTGDLSPHSMENGFRYVLPYDYDEGARCPTFDTFLHQVTGGDQDLADLLMEFAGYSFSGDFPWAQKILVLTGEGSNGKSTFIDVLRALAGKNNYSSLTWKAMNNQTTLQLMDGKLFNISEEAPKHALSDSTLFKNLTTGGEIQLKMLYKQPYEIQNKTKLIFACNELPQSEDTTKGYFRRFLIAPFQYEFSKEKGNVDPHIRGKLVKELPGIFNLVRKGYDRLVKQQEFTDARAAARQLDEYKLEVDHATRWIRENMHVLPLNGGCKWVVSSEVYQNYRNEMLISGEKPLTAVGFGKKLSREIPEYDGRASRKKLQGKTLRVLLDVTCQSEVEM
jgi:putative DNA primase/helicase